MSLSSGTRLGAYEVLSPLGAGGMGEVYKARDTKLGRDVAIKILPELFVADPERVARFEREAQLLAALNHPNIAAIYGLEDSGPTKFLVLELVEGESLDARLRAQGGHTGPPLHEDDALAIARQIVDALEAAHGKGIIHRDLKPANIMLTPEGRVKVLDFGLAKVEGVGAGGSGRPGGAGGDFTQSPTLTYAATQAGMILGTAAYMSPEQAKGRLADKRSDIWGFGCVLYEMLTGKRAFDGEDATEMIAAVVRAEPDWTALPADIPPHVRTLVMRCLAKDRHARLADFAVARFLLDEGSSLASADTSRGGAATGAGSPSSQWRRALPWSLAAAALVALAVVLATFGGSRRAERAATPIRVKADIGGDLTLDVSQGPAMALSPDGTLMVLVAQKPGEPTRLHVRQLSQLQSMALAGTDEARAPFFSPDGQWIGFFAGGKLKKVSVTGGAPVTLCDAPNSRGGTWGPDGTIVFLPLPGGSVSLQRVPAGGGTPETFLPVREGEVSRRWPQILPNGKALIYTTTRTAGSYDDGTIVAQPLPMGEARTVVRGGYFGRYLSSGHLVYVHQGTLFAVAMDAERLETRGQPIPVIDHLAASSGLGFGQFAASNDGTIAYRSGDADAGAAAILWGDRSGKTSMLRAAAADWSNLRFSPDGQRVALDIYDGSKNDIYVYEWSRDTLTRLTLDASDNQKPAWTPDGRRIVFRSNRDGVGNVYWQRADGGGNVERLTDSTALHMPGSWHPSGKYLAFTSASAGGADVMILPMEGDERSGWKPGAPYVFVKGPPGASDPAFSPDGRWIAYFSLGPAAPEVFVQPFPGPGGKRQISNGGGVHPTWSRTGRELLFEALDQRIMVASYSVDGDAFIADKPRRWSDARVNVRPRGFVSVPGRPYDLHPDGTRIAGAIAPPAQGEERPDHVVLVFNFLDELKRLTSPPR